MKNSFGVEPCRRKAGFFLVSRSPTYPGRLAPLEDLKVHDREDFSCRCNKKKGPIGWLPVISQQCPLDPLTAADALATFCRCVRYILPIFSREKCDKEARERDGGSASWTGRVYDFVARPKRGNRVGFHP